MKTRRILSYLLTATTLISTILPSFATYKDSTAGEKYHDIEINSEANNTTVYAEVGSMFKVVIPKHIILDGTSKTGAYTIDVSGDIAGNEVITVVPDEYFRLSSVNKLDIYAYISQDRMSWTYQDMNTLANGLIETENMTAGSWNGNFYFNIKLESSGELESNATNSSGEEVKVTINNIAGVQKEQLLGALVQSGQVSSDEDVDTLLNIDNIEDVDNVEIDTSDIAEPGDTVVIVQEKENEWDYVSTETVNNNNKVILNTTNKKPVSFVQTQSDGTIHVHTYEEQVAVAATCETDGTLLMNCECDKSYSFTIPATHNLEIVEKKDENGELINKYYECTDCTYSILNLTKLFSGEELSHDCNNYLISKYDSTYHWKECSECGEIYIKTTHNYINKGWTLGNANNCDPNNYQQLICTCGYSIKSTSGKKSHVMNTTYNTYIGEHFHSTNCINCSYSINGERCRMSNGTLITCTNKGVCAICKHDFNKHNLHLTHVSSGVATCSICGKSLGTVKSAKTTRNADGDITATIVFTVPNGVSSAVSAYPSISGVNVSNTSYSLNGTTFTSTGRYIATNNYPFNFSASIAVIYNDVYMYVKVPLKAEIIAPTISVPIQTDLSTQNGWSTGKQLTFSGTENYCNMIKLTLKDDKGNIYFNNASVAVNNKNWIYNYTPNLETNESGTTLILTATDLLGNTNTKTFTVSKTDKKAPTSSLNGTTSTEWSKTKEMLFSATDEGSGDVQIAFNNINEYVDMTKNDTLYTKIYQFSGDVYGEVTAAIYYKDAVGNVATQFVKVHNLDNTAPTILNVDRNENILTVSANDLNKELNLEGSGIDSYAITWTSAPPQESDWQESNIFEITKGGTYYLWVRDNVGNVSENYKIKVLL